MHKGSSTPLNYKEALAKAQHFCAYQERCHKEVRNRLHEWKVYGEECEQVLVDLIEGNYLNEERFAKAYAGGKFRVKKWGRKKIVRELKSRDISDYCTKQGLSEIEDTDYLSTLKSLLQLKNRQLKDSNQFTRKAKLAKYAIGKGYESALVWDLLRSDDYRE